MFNKSFLVEKVVSSLLKENFEVLTTDGAFDIAAKRDDKLLLVKILANIDGLNNEHAMSLRAVSYFLSAHPFIISAKNNRESLENNMIYSRFDIPVVTSELFTDIITQDEIVPLNSAKGRHTIEVDAKLLRKKRNELEFTLEQLANKIGISKKAMYEIENERVNPTKETVEKLESVLSIDLKKPFEMKNAPITYLKPKNDFQGKVSKEFSRIGIDNSSVYSAPFEIVGKENFSLITNLSHNIRKVKGASIMKKLSGVFSSKAIFVVKISDEKSVEGVPVVLESELSDIESGKEFSKIIEEKED